MDRLQSCLIRFLYWTEQYENAEKAELNDLEIAKDELIEELKDILELESD